MAAALFFTDAGQLGPAARTLQRDLLGGTDTSDHVFTLGVHQKFTVEQVFPGTGIAGESHTSCAGIAQVAKYHRLYVHRSTPGFRNVIQFTVHPGTIVVPAFKNGHHGTPQLFPGIGGEVATQTRANQSFEALNQFPQVVGIQFSVEFNSFFRFQHVDDDLEGVVVFFGNWLESHYDIAVHLYKAAVRVPGETLVSRFAGQSFHSLVVDAKIENGIHHARH